MNQWDYLNQRADELERALNAGRGNAKSLYDPKKPTLYEIQRQYAEDVKQLRQQFEESQQKQEIKDREQAKENKKNQFYSASALVVGILTLAATIIFGILQVTH